MKRQNGKFHDILFHQFLDKGCDHCNKDGKFGGCSFCDVLSSLDMNAVSLLTLLYRVDQKYYCELILNDLLKNTHAVTAPPSIQFLSGSNTLSEQELPHYLFERLAKLPTNVRRADVTGFDTRADSVNEVSIQTMRTCFSGRLGVNIGVEVADEWLRNHWLHKQTTNSEIEQAVALLKKEGCFVSLSVLIGIPGLSESQSHKLFIDSVEYCLALGADRVMCTPLMHQNNTLQTYFGRFLSQDRDLIERGVMTCKGLYCVEGLLCALAAVSDRWLNDSAKIAINPILFYPYAKQIMDTMESDEQKQNSNRILKVLEYCLKRNTFKVGDRFHALQTLDSYQRYKMKKRGFDSIECLGDTLYVSAQKLCDAMKLTNQDELLADLACEMKNWSAAERGC